MEANDKPVVVEPRRWRGALALWAAVLLGSGFGIGYGTSMLTHRPPPPRWGPGAGADDPHHRPPPPDERGPRGPEHRERVRGFAPQTPPAEVVEQMTEELSLTPDQAGEVAKVYVQRFAEIQKLRLELLPKVAREYDGLHSDLKKILTPEQYAQWNRRYEEVRRRFVGRPPEGREGGEGRQPPPPPGRGGPGGPGGEFEGPPPGGGPGQFNGPPRRGDEGRFPSPPRPGGYGGGENGPGPGGEGGFAPPPGR